MIESTPCNTQVYHERFAPMIPFVRKFGIDQDEAKDVIHDAFMVYLTHESVHSIQESSLKSWVFTVIKNLCLRRIDVAKRYTSFDDQLHDRAISEECFKEVYEPMATLPLKQRKTFEMHAIKGYKHQEISKILKVSENTCRTNYMKAKKKLRGYYSIAS